MRFLLYVCYELSLRGVKTGRQHKYEGYQMRFLHRKGRRAKLCQGLSKAGNLGRGGVAWDM